MAYRLEVVVATEQRPAVAVTFFDKKPAHRRVAGAPASPPGPIGLFSGKVGTFRGQLQLTNPQNQMFGDAAATRRRRGRRGPALGQHPAADHDLPRQLGGAELADRRTRSRWPSTWSRRSPSCCPTTCARSTTSSPRRQALRWLHRPDDLGAEGGGRQAAALRRGVRDPDRARPAPGRAGRAGGRAAHRPATAGCSTGSTSGCRSAHRRPAGGQPGGPRRPRRRAPDAPAAAGRGRVRQDRRRAARDAAGRRLRRPGRAARPDRGARPAAPPLDHRDARRPRRGRHARRRRPTAPGSALLTGSLGAAARREAMLDAASRRGRHRDRHPRAARGQGRSSPTSASSSSTSSTASASSSAPRWPPRRRVPAARAGDDRDPDPAHRRDDGLRRPRDLDAHRAARRPRADPDQRRPARRAAGLARPGLARGSARRSPRATRSTSCARASAATSRRHRPTEADEPTTRRVAAGAVEEVAPMLAEGPLHGLRVEMLHGRLAPDAQGRGDARLRRRRDRRARRPRR